MGQYGVRVGLDKNIPRYVLAVPATTKYQSLVSETKVGATDEDTLIRPLLSHHSKPATPKGGTGSAAIPA